jgi:SNF2 family DNA or RNA helicase
MGRVSIEIEVSSDDVKDLCCKKEVEGIFDDDGEFSTAAGLIPVSRIMDMNHDKKNLLGDKKPVMDIIFALQNPGSSQWKRPFIRVVSNHNYDKKTKKLRIYLYIYFTRLIFELIADPSLKTLMENIENIPVNVIEVNKKPPQPTLFKSTIASDSNLDRHRFSLAGLLKHTENKGYQLASSQPKGLSVNMYDFQLSTYQWMLDQENSPGGLNSLFWEEWQCNDGGPYMYFFPLAGEFRLSKPPKTTGGLLCEEMGLGKTVELIALILGNPCKDLDSDMNMASNDSVINSRIDIDDMDVDIDTSKITGIKATSLAGNKGEAAIEDDESEDDESETAIPFTGSESETAIAGNKITGIAVKVVENGKNDIKSTRQSKRQISYDKSKKIKIEHDENKRDRYIAEKKTTKDENGKKVEKIILSSKATLIVVPSTLLGQWWRELHNRVSRIDKNNINNDGNSVKSFDIINISDIDFKAVYISYKVCYIHTSIYVQSFSYVIFILITSIVHLYQIYYDYVSELFL